MEVSANNGTCGSEYPVINVVTSLLAQLRGNVIRAVKQISCCGCLETAFVKLRVFALCICNSL